MSDNRIVTIDGHQQSGSELDDKLDRNTDRDVQIIKDWKTALTTGYNVDDQLAFNEQNITFRKHPNFNDSDQIIKDDFIDYKITNQRNNGSKKELTGSKQISRFQNHLCKLQQSPLTNDNKNSLYSYAEPKYITSEKNKTLKSVIQTNLLSFKNYKMHDISGQEEFQRTNFQGDVFSTNIDESAFVIEDTVFLDYILKGADGGHYFLTNQEFIYTTVSNMYSHLSDRSSSYQGVLFKETHSYFSQSSVNISISANSGSSFYLYAGSYSMQIPKDYIGLVIFSTRRDNEPSQFHAIDGFLAFVNFGDKCTYMPIDGNYTMKISNFSKDYDFRSFIPKSPYGENIHINEFSQSRYTYYITLIRTPMDQILYPRSTKSSFTYIYKQPPLKLKNTWQDFLENRRFYMMSRMGISDASCFCIRLESLCLLIYDTTENMPRLKMNLFNEIKRRSYYNYGGPHDLASFSSESSSSSGVWTIKRRPNDPNYVDMIQLTSGVPRWNTSWSGTRSSEIIAFYFFGNSSSSDSISEIKGGMISFNSNDYGYTQNIIKKQHNNYLLNRFQITFVNPGQYQPMCLHPINSSYAKQFYNLSTSDFNNSSMYQYFWLLNGNI